MVGFIAVPLAVYLGIAGGACTTTSKRTTATPSDSATITDTFTVTTTASRTATPTRTFTITRTPTLTPCVQATVVIWSNHDYNWPPGGFQSTPITIPTGAWNSAQLAASYCGGDPVGPVAPYCAGYDQWDRVLGNFLTLPGGGRVEINRAVTDWGYTLSYITDVTPFLPAIQTAQNAGTYITSYVSPGWHVNLTLYLSTSCVASPTAVGVVPVFFYQDQEYHPTPTGTATVDTRTVSATINVPAGASQGQFVLYATGHSINGTNCEEFGPPRNITVSLDGTPVAPAVVPWRTDCATTGSHGTTYNRSGWCPHDVVHPFYLPQTPAPITPGAHTVSVNIDNICWDNGGGGYGYWYTSLALLYW